jgi:hypothetical protein
VPPTIDRLSFHYGDRFESASELTLWVFSHGEDLKHSGMHFMTTAETLRYFSVDLLNTNVVTCNHLSAVEDGAYGFGNTCDDDGSRVLDFRRIVVDGGGVCVSPWPSLIV